MSGRCSIHVVQLQELVTLGRRDPTFADLRAAIKAEFRVLGDYLRSFLDDDATITTDGDVKQSTLDDNEQVGVTISSR